MATTKEKNKLVIVESPTKARTITRFLGAGYTVLASYGHVRDLPKSKIGVDVAKNFEPTYMVPAKAKEAVATIRAAAKKSGEILYATDEDREGEAIAWHLHALLDIPHDSAKRIVFHEITKTAIEHALQAPRKLDLHLVDAQQARRILDRLVGYELSPFLWRKVQYGLSAGRVQSAALRIIVEREREIQAFVAREYWTVEATGVAAHEKFPVSLRAVNGEVLDKFDIPSAARAKEIVAAASGLQFKVSDVGEGKVKRSPAAPFTTSTLQQEANHRLGLSVKQTMQLAQQLYEGVDLPGEGSTGLITYMRTDSMNLSNDFLAGARSVVEEKFGDRYLPERPRRFKTKSKGAQEAHEAIRPTEAGRTPDAIHAYLTAPQFKLYQLIWQRAVASQMAEAQFASSSVDLASPKDELVFRATGNRCVFDGFLKVYPTKYEETTLPVLTVGQAVEVQQVMPSQHFTEPPARYSEATLVKALESNGIGRPSTYAPTITTLVDRHYVTREERRLHPTDMGVAVNDLLVKHFPHVVDLKFTADLEQKFDDIAEGEADWHQVLADFYGPFKANLVVKEKEVTKKEATETATDEKCPECGKALIIKLGRYGKFYACTGYPDCKYKKPIAGKNEEAAPEADPNAPVEACPECGQGKLVQKRSRFGVFFGCDRYPDCKYIKKTQNKTGVKCPECKQGELVGKRGRGGKLFYSCDRYPECRCAIWAKPMAENCPDCGWPLVQGPKETIKCSKKGCSYKRQTA